MARHWGDQLLQLARMQVLAVAAKTRNALGKLEGVGHLHQQDAADHTAQAGKHRFPPFFAPHLLSYPDLHIQPRSKLLSFFMFQLSLLTSLSQMCTGHLLRPTAFTCYLSYSQALSYLTRPGTCPRPGHSRGEPRFPPGSVVALGLGSSLHLGPQEVGLAFLQPQWPSRPCALGATHCMFASLCPWFLTLRGWLRQDLCPNQACVHPLWEQEATVASDSSSQTACEKWDAWSREKCWRDEFLVLYS